MTKFKFKFAAVLLMSVLIFTSLTFSTGAIALAGAEILTCKDASSKVMVTIANSQDGDYAMASGFENGATQNLKGSGVNSNILVDDQTGTVSAVSVDKKGNFIQVMASGLKTEKPSGASEECAIVYPHAMAFSTTVAGGAVLEPNLTCRLEIQ